MTDKYTPNKNVSISEGASSLSQVWMEIAKNAADIAHARRDIYNAYVAEGFTEAQAIELIKQI